MKQRNIYSKLKKGGQGFTPHMMYDPENMEGVMAFTEEEHLDLKAKGFLHQDDLKKMMLGGLTDNKNEALESNRNELFRTNPSIATQNERNPGLNNLNNFVNSVALNTQGSLMDGAIQQTQNQFFAGGITNPTEPPIVSPTDPPEDPPNTETITTADYNAQKLEEARATNAELRNTYNSELGNYNTYISDKEKYDAANSGYAGDLAAYNYQQANKAAYPTRFGGMGWRSGLDKSFNDPSKFRSLNEQELSEFNTNREKLINQNNSVVAGISSEDVGAQEQFIPAKSVYVPTDYKNPVDGYGDAYNGFGTIYQNLQKPTAPGAAPTEVIKPTEPSYINTGQYINRDVERLPVISPGTLSGGPMGNIVGQQWWSDKLEAPTYNAYEGMRPERVLGAKNPLRGGRRLTAGLTQKLSGYDGEAMDAEIEAAENEGRRISFEGLGRGSASSRKFQNQYNEEYDDYEDQVNQENFTKAKLQYMLNKSTGQANNNLVQAEQFGGTPIAMYGGSDYNWGGSNAYNPNFGYKGAANFDTFNTANTNALNAGAQGVADLSGFGNSFRKGMINSALNPNMTTKVKTRGKGFMDKLDVLGENIINAPKNMWGKATAGFNELKDFRANQKNASLQPFYNNLTEAGVDINSKDAVNNFIGGKSVLEMNELLGGMLNNQQRFGGPQMDLGGHTHPHRNSFNVFQDYANGNFAQRPQSTVPQSFPQGRWIGSNALGFTPRYFPPPVDYVQQFKNGFGVANSFNFNPVVGAQQKQVQRVGTASKGAIKDEVETGDELYIDPNMPGVTTMDDIKDQGVKVEVDEDGKETIVINEDGEGVKGKKRGNSKNPTIVVDEDAADEDGNLYLPEQVFRLNPRAFGNSTVDGVMTTPYGAVAYNPNETYLNKFKHKTNMFGGNKTVMKFDHAGVDLSADRRAKRKANKDARNADNADNAELNPEDYELGEDNTSWQNNRPETFYHANPDAPVISEDPNARRVSFNAEPHVVGEDNSTRNPNYIGSSTPNYALETGTYTLPTMQTPLQGQEFLNQFGGTPLNNNIDMNYNYDYFNTGGVPSRRDNRQFAREQIQGRDKYSRQDRRRLRRNLNRGLETQQEYMQYQEPAYEQAPIVREDNSFQQNISPMPLIDPGMVTMPEAQPMNLEAANAGVTDDMSFGQAFSTANKALGEAGTFMWRGKKYGTRRDPNWRGKKEEEVVADQNPSPQPGRNGITPGPADPVEAAKSTKRKKLAAKALTTEEMESAFIKDAKARNHIPKNARIGRRQDGTAYVNINGQNREIKSNDGKTWMLVPEGTNSPIYNKRYNYSNAQVAKYNYNAQEDSRKINQLLEEKNNPKPASDNPLFATLDAREDEAYSNGETAEAPMTRTRRARNAFINAGINTAQTSINEKFEDLVDRFPYATPAELIEIYRSGDTVPERDPGMGYWNGINPETGELYSTGSNSRYGSPNTLNVPSSQNMPELDYTNSTIKHNPSRVPNRQYGGPNGNMYGQGISGYYGNGGANMYGYGGADMYGNGGMNYFPQAPTRRVVRMQAGGSDMVSIHQGELAKLQEMAAMGQQAMQSNEMYNAMNNGINPMG